MKSILTLKLNSILYLISVVLMALSCGKNKNINKSERSNFLTPSDVVYGDNLDSGDNRSETVLEDIMNRNNMTEENAKKWKKISESVALMVDAQKIKKNYDGSYSSSTKLNKLAEKRTLCPSERFKDQYIFGVCTGFLISPIHIMTAGHCVKNKEASDLVWVFNYDYEYANDESPNFLQENVHLSKEILLTNNNSDDKYNKDFALILLDKEVTHINPVIIRQSRKITDNRNEVENEEVNIGDSLVMIGHPYGLPMKIVGGAQVINFKDDFNFLTDLDAAHGNSGSPVFNQKSGFVEGILVAGKQDWINNDDCSSTYLAATREGEEKVFNLSTIDLSQYITQNNRVVNNSDTLISTDIERPIVFNLLKAQLKFKRANGKKRGLSEINLWIDLPKEMVNLIKSVTYIPNFTTSFTDFTSFDQLNNFSYSFKTRRKTLKIDVNFSLYDGTNQQKEYLFNIY